MVLIITAAITTVVERLAFHQRGGWNSENEKLENVQKEPQAKPRNADSLKNWERQGSRLCLGSFGTSIALPASGS